MSAGDGTAKNDIGFCLTYQDFTMNITFRANNGPDNPWTHSDSNRCPDTMNDNSDDRAIYMHDVNTPNHGMAKTNFHHCFSLLQKV